MKKPLSLVFVFLVPLLSSFAQQRESFDLATFTVPRGWKKASTAADVVSYAVTNNQKGTYCQIGIYRSMSSAGSLPSDFQLAWQDLIVKGRKNVTAAVAVPAAAKAGWQVQGATASYEFNGRQSVATLVTWGGYATSVSIVILTNTDAYQADIRGFLDSVELATPAGTGGAAKPPTETAAQPRGAAPPVKNTYAFTATNFDDGWVSTAREDWVEVAKGGTRVLIHHPNKQADQYNSVLRDGLQTAWNVLVAPRYRSIRDLQLRPITGWQSIEFAEADAVDAATGNPAHVVLFKYGYSNGSGRYMEFITRDKGAFEREFGPYHESTSGWERMEKMAGYNRFAVAASDLTGKWTNDFSGALQYVNAYTGANAGMATHASNQNFVFGPGNTYQWDLAVASGMVGNIKFQSVKSSGSFSLPSNWQVAFSDIEGKPRTYDAYFACVKGARILWLGDTGYGRLE